MPRYNISIPDYLVEQWEEKENRSKWIQEKLDEEWKLRNAAKRVKEYIDEPENVQRNQST